MKITILGIGNRMPSWVEQGYQEFAQRFKGKVQLALKELPAEKRTKKANIPKILEAESKRLMDAIPAAAHVVALDVEGKTWSTEQLSEQLNHWMMHGKEVVMLIGGPEGMTKECLQRADQVWSLSPLTFPHPLVRVILAEQLYRAWSITENHPYHRAG